MNNQTNLERLIEAATKYGYTEDQTVLICDEIGRAAYEQFSQEIERLFSPEEKQMIEELQGEDRIQSEIKKLYQDKTGNDAQEVVNGYISRHIDEFISDHETGAYSPAA